MYSKYLHACLLLLALPLAGTSAADVGESPQRPRTWTSAGGKFHVRATLIEAGGASVLLQKETGNRITVPRASLSPADLAYIDRHATPKTDGRAAGPQTAVPSTVTPGKAAVPAADNPQGLTCRSFDEQYIAFLRRGMREAYLKAGKTSPAWNEAALKLIDASALAQVYAGRNAVNPDPPPPEPQDLDALAEAVRQAGCDDPLILSLCLEALPVKAFAGKHDLAAAALGHLTEVEKRGYPPLLVAATARRVHRVLAPRDEGRGIVREVVLRNFIEAISSKELQGLDRRFLLRTAHEFMQIFPQAWDYTPVEGATYVPDNPNPIIEKLRSSENADRWLVDVLLGEMDVASGTRWEEWRERVAGRDPKSYWDSARRRLTAAWKQHPEYPEAAALMMHVVRRGGAVEGETIRLWFERAVSAQADWPPALAAMRKYRSLEGDPQADGKSPLPQKDLEESDRQLSKSILDGGDATLAAKAYLKLAVNHTREGHKFAAQVAAAMGWHLDQKAVDHETIREFAKGASTSDFARVLCFDEEVPKLSKREPSPLTEVKLGKEVPESIFQMMPDPQGGYVVVLAEGLRGYYLVRTEGELVITKVPWQAEIGCGCLVDGKLYLVPLGKPRLIEVEPTSGKEVKVYSLGDRTTYSIAVFPRHGLACFTHVVKPIPYVFQIDLATGVVAETALHGQDVAGDPAQRFVFCVLRSPHSAEKSQVAVGRHVVRSRVYFANDYGASTLFRAAVVPKNVLLSDVLDHAASGGGRIRLLPDGHWLGVPAHDGWLPAERLWDGPTGMGVPVFSAHRLGHVAQFLPRRQFCHPLGMAFNPVTLQVALAGKTAMEGVQSLDIAQLGEDKIVQTIRLSSNGVCAWSGNGAYLLVAGGKAGIAAYTNRLSDADKQFAGQWWKSLHAEPLQGDRK